MLLTSGQLSMTISSCIVFVFTSLLFLSGYILQQQSVRDIQHTLHPPIAEATQSAYDSESPQVSGVPSGVYDHVAYQEYLSAPRPAGGWNKVAYVQLVRDPIHVCNALMLFSQLQKMGSPAARVIVYPSSWTEEGVGSSARTETVERLLGVMKQRLDVQLHGVAPFRKAQKPDEEYPVSSLFSLTEYDRLLFLPPSGILLGRNELDHVLAISSLDTIISIRDPAMDNTSSLLLLRPSTLMSDNIMEELRDGLPDREILAGLEPLTLNSTLSSGRRLLFSTSTLHNLHLQIKLDVNTILTSSSYIHVSDVGLPGPEYDIPRDVYDSARPKSAQAANAWDEIRVRYRDLRLDVCGLDLEPYPLTLRSNAQKKSQKL